LEIGKNWHNNYLTSHYQSIVSLLTHIYMSSVRFGSIPTRIPTTPEGIWKNLHLLN